MNLNMNLNVPMSPTVENLVDLYVYLSHTYQIGLNESEKMRFNLRVKATPKRIAFVTELRAEFQEFLEKLLLVDKKLDALTEENKSSDLIVSAIMYCKEVSGYLQNLSKYIIEGIDKTTANFIFDDENSFQIIQ